MLFSSMLKDKIQVLKSDGTKSSELNANVQSKGIYLLKSDILVEPGDLIERLIPDGDTETFQVIESLFHEGAEGAIPAHYRIKVTKLELPEAEEAIHAIPHNSSTQNAKENNSSTDNSNNVVNENNDLLESIKALKAEINRLKLSVQEKSEAIEVVGAIEAQCNNEKPSKVVVNALISSLPTAASIAAIGSLIVSLL